MGCERTGGGQCSRTQISMLENSGTYLYLLYMVSPSSVLLYQLPIAGGVLGSNIYPGAADSSLGISI